MRRLLASVAARAAGALALAVVAGAPPAHAQDAKGIYTCIDDKGRRLTADRPIRECASKEQRVLNSDGSVKSTRPPTLTAEERAEQEARDRAAAELKAQQADAVRRDRNLMARFPNEAAHRKAREAALDTVRLAAKATELRLRDLAAERKPLLAEAEFYAGKALPAKLRQALDANDAAIEAQHASQATQAAEVDRLNRLYDAELGRLKALWGGAAPGSLGPALAPAPPAVNPGAAASPAARPASRPGNAASRPGA